MSSRADDALVWFRRDLRLADHAPLAAAIGEARRVHCVFVFDRDILAGLAADDRRITFIHASLALLDARLAEAGSLPPGTPVLHVMHARAVEAIPALAAALGAAVVFAGEDYEPAARQRDAAVAAALRRDGRTLATLADQVVFAPGTVRSAAGSPYTVYTPYRRAWEKRLAASGDVALAAWRSDFAPGQLQAAGTAHRLADADAAPLAPLAAYGFRSAGLAGVEPGERGAVAALDSFAARIDDYAKTRDYPALGGTSGLSPHLRFGTLSVRAAARAAMPRGAGGEGAGVPDEAARGAAVWLGELVWRDFFFAVLEAFPHSASGNFRPAYDRLAWVDHRREGAPLWAAWCAGRTGYPLVDAGMRELLGSGRMHNRVRMVVASFLCKHLGIDWRAGERFFAAHLLDYDLAANAGNWQWAASTGCDAQPYFRIFNPVSQSQRFDADGAYIRRHVPELAALGAAEIHAPWLLPAARRPAGYPPPLVDHAAARDAALARFAAVRG